MIKRNIDVKKIDNQVRINDRPALRALSVLQDINHEKEYEKLLEADIKRDRSKSKGRLIYELRSAIGYGGMIHNFKNYVIRNETQLINQIQSNFNNLWEILDEYKLNQLSTTEKHALEDILHTMQKYESNVSVIEELSNKKRLPMKIDAAVVVDDSYALRALSILEREIAIETEKSADIVNSTLHELNDLIKGAGIVALSIITVLILVFIWLMVEQIINPLKRAEKVMTELANDQLDVEIEDMGKTNEMGAIAKAIYIFRKNAIKQKSTEEKLEKSNSELSTKIEQVEKVREEAQLKTEEALKLADNLADARVTAEAARHEAEAKHNEIKMILNTARDAIICADEKGIITTFNPGAENMFGYTSNQAVGKNISFLMPGEMGKQHKHFLGAYVDGSRKREPNMSVEQIAQDKNGRNFPIEISLNSMRTDGHIMFTTVIRDVTERKAAEEKIKELAVIDSLTGLSNRHRFQQRLEENINLAERLKNKFIVLMMDLDKFKPINDEYGHLIGDEVLKNIANKIKQTFRSIDTVARFGGDEFSVIISNLKSSDEALFLINRIINTVNSKVAIQGHELNVGISIGASVYPDDSTDGKKLIEYADISLYRAKKMKGSKYCFYDSNLKDIKSE